MRSIKLFSFLGLVLTLLLGTTVAQAQTTTCKLTPATSTFSVHTDTEGLLSALAHKRLIQATKFDGKIIYVEDTVENSTVEILIETDGLLTTEKDISESDRTEIIANMREALATKSYPTMHFSSHNVTPIKEGIKVQGTLRMKGTAKKIVVDVKLERIENVLVSSGEFTVKQTAFGIEPYSALMGTIKVADEIRFEFKAACELPVQKTTTAALQ